MIICPSHSCITRHKINTNAILPLARTTFTQSRPLYVFIRLCVDDKINVHYFNLFKRLKKYLSSLSFNDIIIK